MFSPPVGFGVGVPVGVGVIEGMPQGLPAHNFLSLTGSYEQVCGLHFSHVCNPVHA